MIFTKTDLGGVFIVEPEPINDSRGFFARTFDRDDFAARGLCSEFAQCAVSFNARRATLRGMHYQVDPHGQCKLVRCTRGAIYDVIVDLRRESPSYCRWLGVELTPDNHRMLYAPRGVAQGFISLQEASEVFYQLSESRHPESERGVRWNDPAFAIDWPLAPEVISGRDQNYPDFAR